MPESPISNPLAPPGFNPTAGRSEKPLSNADFRKIMMTPRATPGRSGGGGGGGRGRSNNNNNNDAPPPIVDDDPDRPISNPVRPVDGGEERKGPDEDAVARQKARQKWQQRNKDKEKEKEKEAARYRDRAKERRDGVNPDYAESEAQMAGFHSVPPPDGDYRNAQELHKISIENSKFLGGDMEHTHLVKGLDFALLNKVKSENQQKEKEKEKPSKDVDSQDKKLLKQMMPPPPSVGGKAPTLAQAIGAKKATDSALASLAATSSSSSVAQTVLGKAIMAIIQAAPSRNEMFQPGRMAFVFDMDPEFPQELPTTLIRSKDDCPAAQQSLAGSLDPILLDKMTKVMSFLRQGSRTHQKKLKKKEKSDDTEKAPAKPAPAPAPIKDDEDIDIFGDVGTDYVVTVNKPTNKPKEDKDVKMQDEKPKKDEKDKSSYFLTPTEKADDEVKNTAQQALQQAKLLTAALNAKTANEEKQKEEPKKDNAQSTKKDKDDREKDPNYVGDSYTECYPGSFETATYAYESDDDEEDITKMGSKKGKLKRWDFDDEESWNEYNDQREAMPKAAFQFGVKMSDGRKTRRNTKDKFSQDVSKINNILKQRAVDAVQAKKHGGEGGGDNRAKRRKAKHDAEM